MSAKGVGNVLAFTLMHRDSGNYQGKRYSRGVRAKVHTVPFVSMMSAIQCHPKLKPMCERMVVAGKPKKVVLVACMSKQLTILNAMVRYSTCRDEKMA